jgi:hypothetical protein
MVILLQGKETCFTGSPKSADGFSSGVYETFGGGNAKRAIFVT